MTTNKHDQQIYFISADFFFLVLWVTGSHSELALKRPLKNDAGRRAKKLLTLTSFNVNNGIDLRCIAVIISSFHTR